MEEQPTWVIMDRTLRWFTLTPKVVDSAARIGNIHQHHLTLTSGTRPRAVCGRYDPDDFHPHQLSGTWAMGKGDACAECVRVAQQMRPHALKGVNHLYVTEGQMIPIPAPIPQDSIPAQIWDAIAHVGSQVHQAQSAYLLLAQALIEWFAHQGIEPPPAFQTLLSAPPIEGIVPLFRLADYTAWIERHPQGMIATVRSPSLAVHRVGCHHERGAAFVPCYGAVDGNVIDQTFQGITISWCNHCLAGRNPDRRLLPPS